WLGPLLELLIRHARRLVIDADALNEISRTPDRYGPLLLARKEQGFEPAVLTPHPGEFRRLAPDIDQTDRLAAARTLAARTGCLVVLKGACTVIADPGGACWLNTTGQDGLARGGSGDLLTGLIAGFLAQGLPAWQAAGAAVYVHGLAADLAARDIGRRAMLPRDVLRKLGSALRRIGWEEEDV
ncbi:MAG: NAD(P)H-hydrate dehydratase, partial [Clostridiaceae bacterium]|nr:NAD(P)H-hydrate dehydratase [Clostridiaceae bacterium]